MPKNTTETTTQTENTSGACRASNSSNNSATTTASAGVTLAFAREAATQDQGQQTNSAAYIPYSSSSTRIHYIHDKEYIPDPKAKIFEAIAKNNEEGLNELENLLQRAISPDIENENGDTALLVAMQHKNYDAAATLFYHGADPNKTDDNGNTPLLFAINLEDEELLDILLDQPKTDVNAVKEGAGITPLCFAINKGWDSGALKLINCESINLNKPGFTKLTDEGGFNLTPLLNAILCSNNDIAIKLIAAGAGLHSKPMNINKDDHTFKAFEEILTKDNFSDILDYILQTDKVDFKNYLRKEGSHNVLHLLAAKNSTKNLKLILDRCSQEDLEKLLNQEDNENYKPVHLAINNLSIEFVKTLVSFYPQSLEITDHQGLTPFQMLAMDSYLIKKEGIEWANKDREYFKNCVILDEEITQSAKDLICNAPAEVLKARNPISGNNPIHTTASTSCFDSEFLQLLLQKAKEIDPQLIDQPNNNGIKPVQIHFHDSDYDTLKIFLDYEPRLTYEDENGSKKALLATDGKEIHEDKPQNNYPLIYWAIEKKGFNALVPKILEIANNNSEIGTVIEQSGKDLALIFSYYNNSSDDNAAAGAGEANNTGNNEKASEYATANKEETDDSSREVASLTRQSSSEAYAYDNEALEKSQLEEGYAIIPEAMNESSSEADETESILPKEEDNSGYDTGDILGARGEFIGPEFPGCS
jgi:ankyrin repeat protein